MRILYLVGSGRKKGNTANMISLLDEQLHLFDDVFSAASFLAENDCKLTRLGILAGTGVVGIRCDLLFSI